MLCFKVYIHFCLQGTLVNMIFLFVLKHLFRFGNLVENDILKLILRENSCCLENLYGKGKLFKVNYH